MDRGYFLNAGIQPLLHFESSPSPTWQTLSSAPDPNCSPELSSDCFLNPSWDKSTDQFSNFESMVSSPSPSPAASTDSFGIRQLIGKLGTICNSVGIPSPHSCPFPAATAAYIGSGNNSTSMPSNLPRKKENPPNSGHSMLVNPNLLDTGFAKRAEKFFSSSGSRSFNGQTSQLGLNKTELSNRPNPLMNFPGVSSTPLKAAGSPMGPQENKNSTQTQVEIRSTTIASNTKFSKIPGFLLPDRTEFARPNEGPSVSDQNHPSGEIGLRAPTDSNSRKRKAIWRGKSSVNTTKVAEAEDELNTKRSKSSEGSGNENGSVKTDEERKRTINGVSADQKEAKADDSKPPEPQKDYIHVRARRGQATDSHSLAERVRREKISERMKLLQDLVPGCNKVTGKALMLDEIINYVQSLQRQVEFLSMKLASVSPRLDFNMEGLLSKDVFQPNRSFPHPTTYPLDSSESSLFGKQSRGIPQVHTNGALTQSSGDPIDTVGPNNGFQFDKFGQGGLPQFSTLCEDDLQSIVQMGFGQHQIEL